MSGIIYSYLLVEILVVSYFDIKNKTISNLWSLIHLVLYGLLFVFVPQDYFFGWNSFIHPVSFFVVGYILYLWDIMGAGDVKYITTLILLIPGKLHYFYIEKIIEVTILFSLLILILNFLNNSKGIIIKIKERRFKEIFSFFGNKFSFAPVLLLTWFVFGWKIWNILRT